MRILLYLIILFGLVYRDLAFSINDIRKKFSQLESKVSSLESSNQIQKSTNKNLTTTMKRDDIGRETFYDYAFWVNKGENNKGENNKGENNKGENNKGENNVVKLHEATNKNLISSRKNLISSNKNLIFRITSIEATNLHLISSNTNLISSNKNLISSNKNLTSRITSIEATNKNLISSNKNLISSNKNLISSSKKLVASNVTLSREINGLKSSILSLSTRICALLSVDSRLNNKDCQFEDCLALYQAGVKKNGIYNVTMGGTKTMEVYCDQTSGGGGWTVIQRRKDGSTDFHRNWSDYKQGFGDNRNEFFIGNSILNNLSVLGKTKGSELRVDMEDFEGNRVYAKYSLFKVDDESAKYRLHVTGYTGNAGDSLAYHNGEQFSTLDGNSGSCANQYRGGWWYSSGCFMAHLNGEYLIYKQPQPGHARGIIWGHWKGYSYSLKFVEMKVRRNV